MFWSYEVVMYFVVDIHIGEYVLIAKQLGHFFSQNNFNLLILFTVNMIYFVWNWTNRRNISWWCHQMKTFSVLLAICAGNSSVTDEFLTQRPVTQSFDVFFDLRLNKWLSKQGWGWWFEMPSRSLWRHCNVATTLDTEGLVLQHQGVSSRRADYASMRFRLFLWVNYFVMHDRNYFWPNWSIPWLLMVIVSSK